MTFAYVTSHGAQLCKQGERLLVRSPENEQLAELEARHLKGVVMLNTVQVTTQALTELLEHDVELAIVTRNGNTRRRCGDWTCVNSCVGRRKTFVR